MKMKKVLIILALIPLIIVLIISPKTVVDNTKWNKVLDNQPIIALVDIIKENNYIDFKLKKIIQNKPQISSKIAQEKISQKNKKEDEDTDHTTQAIFLLSKTGHVDEIIYIYDGYIDFWYEKEETLFLVELEYILKQTHR